MPSGLARSKAPPVAPLLGLHKASCYAACHVLCRHAVLSVACLTRPPTACRPVGRKCYCCHKGAQRSNIYCRAYMPWLQLVQPTPYGRKPTACMHALGTHQSTVLLHAPHAFLLASRPGTQQTCTPALLWHDDTHTPKKRHPHMRCQDTHPHTLCQHTHWLSPAKTRAENRQDTYVHSFRHNLVQCLQDALQTQARTLLVPSSPADTVRLCLSHNQTSKLTRQRSW